MTANTHIDTERPTKANPPHVCGLPWLGNFARMAKDPAKFFVEGYRKYGPVFEITLFGQTYKVIAGPEAALFMSTLQGKECLRSKEFWEGLAKEWGATNSLPGSDGEVHSELRAIFRHSYSKDGLAGHYNEMLNITDGALRRDWKAGSKVPVVQSMQFMVTDQLGTLLTGAAPLKYVVDIRITILNILNVLVTRQRPGFMLWNPRYRRAKKRVFELGDKMKAEYFSAKDQRTGDQRNLIDAIMQANADRPDLMPDSNLRLQMVAPYVAGLDTVANTTAAVTYCILKHPEVHQQVLDEVDTLFNSNGELEEEAGLLKRIPILNGAIMEAMRLYPIAVAQMRCANKDFVFEGHQFREGEMIYMAATVAHFMEEFFPKAMSFDVHRYDKERNEHKQQGAYSPYGRGPHTCLGKTAAEIILALTMARLFYRLDLSLESAGYKLKRKSAPTPGPAMSFKVKVNGYRHPAADYSAPGR